MLIQLVANGLIRGSLWALVALGFSVIYNTTKVFHIAHGAVFTFSPYILYTLYVILHWPLPLAFLLSGAIAVLLGFFMEGVLYKPLAKREASLLVIFLSSLGFYIVIVNLIAMIYGNETKVLRAGVEKTYTLGPVILTRVQVAELVAFLLLFPALMLFLRHSYWGKAIRAVRDNPLLALTLGIPLGRVRYLVFGLGSAFAGIAGMLQALDVGTDPHVGMPALLNAAVAVIIGGIGIFEGAAVGAFLLGILQSLVIWKISAQWVEGVTFLLLILFLVFRPEGLLGTRKRLEELAT